MSNITQLKQKWVSRGLKLHQRRGVSPIIATLLLVAIAVVGGSIIFVFSQGFFATAQISGSPQIESIKILGYDATDGDELQFNDGISTSSADLAGNSTSDELRTGEYIAVYLKNNSVNQITINEIRLAGTVYPFIDLGAQGALMQYTTVAGAACADPTSSSELDCGEYTMVSQADDGIGTDGLLSTTRAPELQPGHEATVVIAIEKDVKIGRDMQFRLATTNGAVFIATIQSGQQSG